MSASVELAQVWVPLMPEASKLAAGVEKIGADAERRFGRATKTMGSQMAANLDRNAAKTAKALKDVERATTAVERAKKRDADATGRVEVAQKRLNEVSANTKAKESQRAAATEAVARAQRAQELTATELTRATRSLTAAQAAQKAAAVGGSGAVMGAGMAGLSSRLAAQAESAGGASGRRFVAGFGSMLKTGAALAVGGGMIAALKGVVDVGVGMESNLNRFQGVTRSNAETMAAAAEVAKQLGADTQIVGASAADAAAAMLELAKGGLTAEQAMAASRGTLQLAAAGQIDAATAATSQATILNSFQLGPDQAEHVADVLANLANAAQGEIPDFMLGMQQASAVAHGFGISMEDTAAVLGLFAKAGIRGSDAGTSLKTMLTHLANPSDKASGAMAELGLQTTNAAGAFVGMPELFRQIGEASARMRPDDFQRAAATLFGTDAIRGAMIAGSQGIDTLNEIGEEVRVLGGAGRMASSNMQGVPGVMEKISNAADTAKLAVYDLLKPILESGGNKVTDWLNSAAEAFDRLKEGGGGTGMQMLRDGWRDISGAVKDLAPALLKITRQMAKGVGGAVITGWRMLGTALKVIEPPLKLAADLFARIPGLATGVATAISLIYLKSKLAGPALSVAAKATGAWEKAFSGWTTQASKADKTMTAFRTSTGETMLVTRGFGTQMRDSYRTAAAGASRFTRTVGAAKGAVTGLKIAGRGAMGLFGGPWGAALTAATIGLGYLTTRHAEAAEQAREQADAERELQSQLEANTGAITEQARQTIASRLQDAGVLSDAKALGLDPHRLLEAATDNDDALTELRELADDAITRGGPLADTWRKVKDAVLEQAVAYGRASKKQKEYGQTLNGVGEATEEAVEHFKKLGAAIVDVPNAKTIVVEGLTEEAIEDLRDAGYEVEQIPGTKQVVIVPKTEEAKAAWKDFVREIEQTRPVVGIDVDVSRADEVYRDWVSQVKGKPIILRPTMEPGSDPFALPPASGALPAPPPGFPAPPGRAEGGLMPGAHVTGSGLIRGPGTGTSDSILARTNRGRFLRVSNGESINTEASTRRNYPLIRKMNAGWVPPVDLLHAVSGLPRFNTGGLINLERVVDELVGAPYVRGGHSFSGVDCSGAASMLVNAALGLPVSRDRMATGNASEWLSARGFVSGAGPAGTLRVGWVNGGPGGGHMAVTLPDGRNAESGGKHGTFMVGAGAAGADDSQFTNHAYLPIEALYPDGYPSGGGGGYYGAGYGPGGGYSGGGRRGGGGGFSSVEAKDRAATSAQNRVSDAEARVSEAELRLQEVEANDKAKESQREHARNQLAKAERDRDLAKRKLADAEAKPVGGGRGAVSSGPDVKNFGSEFLKGLLEVGGIDGETFGDPTQWGIFKFGAGMANYLGGILKNFAGPSSSPLGAASAGGVGDGGFGGDIGGGSGGGAIADMAGSFLPQVRDFLPPQPQAVGTPVSVDQSTNISGVMMSRSQVESMTREQALNRKRTYDTGLPKLG